MMLKLMGLLLIAMTGAMLGVSASLKLKFRVQFLEKYITLMRETRTRIRLSACDIRELFKNDTGYEPLDKMTADFTRRVKDGETVRKAWNDAVKTSHKEHGSAREDTELIAEFGTEFGQNDIEGEIGHIDMHLALVEDRLLQAREEFAQKGKLYRILGFFAGVTVAVVIM